MFLKRFHTPFHSFINQCDDFNDTEKTNIHNIFEKDIMKNKIINFLFF